MFTVVEHALRTQQAEVLELKEAVKSGGCPTARQLMNLRRGRLAENEKMQVETHVVFCENCSREYMALEALNSRNDEELLQKELDGIMASEQTRQVIRQLFLRL